MHATNIKNTTNKLANKTIKGGPKTVPITGLYIVPIDWISNATSKNLRKIYSSSGTKNTRNTTNIPITGKLRLNLPQTKEVKT